MATKEPSAFTSAYEQPDDLLGLAVGDHLVLRSVLGVGSFGVVYEATSSRTPSTTYAVKALFKDGLTDEDLVIQALEGQLMRKLSHENIAHLYDIIDTPECTFLVLEQCETDLYDLIETQTLSAEEGKFFFDRICAAVQHSHALGIYHRDLKPENILLTYEGDLKVTDFGLATTESTSSDLRVGSVRYMSPECFDGEQYNCAKNDIWALGIILMNLIVGRSPWLEPSASRDCLYAQFVSHGVRSFQSRFGITEQFAIILDQIFNHRVDIAQMRKMVAETDMFLMPQESAQLVPDILSNAYATPNSPSELSFSVTGFNWADDEDMDNSILHVTLADEKAISVNIEISSEVESEVCMVPPGTPIDILPPNSTYQYVMKNDPTVPAPIHPYTRAAVDAPHDGRAEPLAYIDTGQLDPASTSSHEPPTAPSHLITPNHGGTIPAVYHGIASTSRSGRSTFTHHLARRLKVISAETTRMVTDSAAVLQCFLGAVGQKLSVAAVTFVCVP